MVKNIAINVLSADQGKDDPLDLVMFLACECSSNLGLLSSLELSRAKFISQNARLFEDLDAEGLNFVGDMVIPSGVRNVLVIGDEFKTLLNLREEAAMVLLFFNGYVLIIGKGGSGNGSLILFSNKEAHTMGDNGQNCMVRTARTNQQFWKSKLLSYQKSSTTYILNIY